MDQEVDRAREAVVNLPVGFYLSIKDSDLVELYMLPRVVGPFNPEVFEVAPIMHILPHELPQDPRNLGVGNIGDGLREIFQRSDSLLFIMQGNPLKGPAWRMCVKGNTICERSIVYRGPQHLGFRSMFYLMENGRSTGWLMDVFEVSDRNNVAIMDWRIVKFRQKVIDIEVIEGINFGLPLLNEVARVLNLLHNFENGWGASRDDERELIVEYLFARVSVLNHPNYPPIFEDSPILRVPIEDLPMDPRNLPQEMRTIYNAVGSLFFLFSQEPTLVPVGGPFEWHQCTPKYDGITGAQNEIISSHRTTFFHQLRENGGISSGWLMHIYRPTQLGVEIHLGNQDAPLDLNWRLVRIYRKIFEILPDVIAPNGNPPVDNPPGDNPPGDNPPGDNPPGDNPPIANPEFPLEQLDESADVNLEENEEVTITPEVMSSKVCRDIISELVKLYRESHLGKCWQAYDGNKSLYAAGSLPFSSKDFVVKLVDKDRKDRRVHKFDVAIKFALQQFLGGRQLDVLQETLDVALPSALSTNFVFVRMLFLLPSLGDTGTLGHGLQYWKGFYQSLQPTQMGLSLSVDMSARAFYEPVLVSKFVEVYCNIRDLKMTLSDQDRIGVQKALTNIRVEVVYRDGRQYKISGVLAQPLSQLMFSRDDLGTKSLVVEFYPERYQINLSFPSLPAFQAGSYAKPVYLPMEFCKIVEGQMCSKKLNETALLRATSQRPADREQSINKMVGYNNYNNDNLVNDFGLRVKAELATIDARVLPLPMLQYLGKQEGPQVGFWNIIDKKMVNGGKVAFWTCVSFSQMRQNEVYRFCEELVNVCRNKGMDFDPPHLIPIDSAHPGRIEKALVDIHAQSNEKLSKMGHTRKQLQFIIILPEVSGSYGTIKRVCETELGMISQCNQPRHAMKCQKQYLENHSLKFNVKACVSLENCHGLVWGPKSASSDKSAARIAMHKAGERTPVNAKMVKSRYTTGAASQSFTSTSYDRVTINDFEYVTAEKNPKKTTHGDLNIELHCDIAPRVCENFITLCERGYYNGVAFRRNIRNFMIRVGDPTGTGKGGESVWGKPFKDEVDSRLLHSGRGVVSMAYSGPHTNGSQFFILYKSANHLNFKCTVFGGVVGGLLTLSAMEKVPVDDDDDDRPLPDEEDKKEKAKDEKNAEDEDNVGSWYSNPGTGAMESGAGSGGVGKYLRARSAQPESAAAATGPQASAVVKKRKMGAPVGGFKDFLTW